jgi:hypothetical protein
MSIIPENPARPRYVDPIAELRAENQDLRTQLADATRKLEEARKDAERLNQFENWADEGLCPALVFNDDGKWAVSFEGMQSMDYGSTHYSVFVPESEWCDSPKEAIDQAIEQGKGGDDELSRDG